ncbi:MAG: alkaline phosphatase family protein [Rikenellaceae bacterium]
MLKKITLSLILSFACMVTMGQKSYSPPRLVVNIIVGAMRSGDIDRYRNSFSDGGFVRLKDGGVNFTNASYSFHQTLTPTSLATLSTGALPSSHGVVGYGWWEYILGSKVDLVEDDKVRNLDYNIRDHGYSAHRLSAPTLTEGLLQQNPLSKSVSIALDASSAIMMSGQMGEPYWIDPLTCEWGSSTAFMDSLPEWTLLHNKSTLMKEIINERWVSLLPQSFYVNSYSEKLQKPSSPTKKFEVKSQPKAKSRVEQIKINYEQLAYTPAGNRLILEYAKRVVESMDLGGDTHPDVLNIYLDPARNIAQRYGASSVEVEDMYRHLDHEIGDLVATLTKRMHSGEVVFVVTSDHGISPTYGEEQQPKGRFSASQFMVLTNSFLRARYGDDSWVLGYQGRNLYLNHELIFKHNLSVGEVQNEVASFALQFRGVAHAITASAMRSGHFGSGYGQKMQNSFYPRRSGDVVLNFMPGWIEEREGVRADAGSTYRYDNHVPLIIYGEGYFLRQSISRELSMECVAPTLARIMGIESPAAADGEPIEEIVNVLK